MPTVNITPSPRLQFFDSNGDPLASAQLFTYEAGTTTKEATYQTSAGSVANTNPIILDASGRTPNGVWLTDGQLYKFVLAPSTDTDPPASPIFTEDNIEGTNDVDAAGNTQWVASGFTPTYVTSTSFTVTGDQTSTLDVGRRLQFTVSGGTVYGHIDTSVYTSLTTVTMTMDAGDSLDAGLSTFNISVLSGTNHAVPSLADAEWTLLGLPVLGSANAFTGDNTHTGKIIMSGKAIDEAVHTEAAHATTSDIWAGGNTCLLSGGVVTFTDVADAPQAGAVRYVVANDAHVITDNAALEVDGNENYTCRAGDLLRFEAKTTSTFRVSVVATGDGLPVKNVFATESEVETGTSTTLAPSVDSFRKGMWVHTSLDTTSGTSHTVSSIPNWVTQIVLTFDNSGMDGTDNFRVRIGDSGGVESTGYVSGGTTFASASVAVSFSSTEFFVITSGANQHGTMILSRDNADSFTWTASCNTNSSATNMHVTSGSKTLSAALDRVEITPSGSDNFDSGSIGVAYS